MMLHHFIGPSVARAAEIMGVSLWYKFVMAKFTKCLYISKALFLINLEKNLHILP